MEDHDDHDHHDDHDDHDDHDHHDHHISEPIDGQTLTAAADIEHEETDSCRCGCVPPDMKSLFQMAALRAKHRENVRAKAEKTRSDEVGDVAQMSATN